MIKILFFALVASFFALSAAAQSGPSFDCNRASTHIENVICWDPDVGDLDGEMARLYSLAQTGPDMTRARLDELVALQRNWLMSRDSCAGAQQLRACLLAAYGQRILELRTYYAGARVDETGVSFGPVAYQCDALPAPLQATFINLRTSYAMVSWEDNAVMLVNSTAADGAKYGPSVWGDPITFWTWHDEATFSLPGQGDTKCIQLRG